MPTRRSILLAGAAALAAPLPALAAPRRAAPRPAGPGALKTLPPPAPPPPSTPATTPIGPVATTARWALVTDADTGAVLLHKAATERMVPSSLTKLMTVYIVFSLIKAGRLTLDQTMLVSRKAWRMGGSKMFVPLGAEIPLRALLHGIVTQSGNDACIVVAEAIAGSEDAFAQKMNDEAKRIHLVNSHFANATGWPNPDHWMCAADVMTLCLRIIHEFPDLYKQFMDQRSFTFSGIKQYNRNPMVLRGTGDGLKTGHTEAGGYGLAASAERGGRRVVVVLNGMPAQRDRSEEGDRLMNWAFSQFEDVKVFTAGQVLDTVPVWLGTAKTVPVVVQGNLVLTLPHGWRAKGKLALDYTAPLAAPVRHGAVIGRVVLSGTGMPDATVPVVAGADVARLGVVGRALAVLPHVLTGG